MARESKRSKLVLTPEEVQHLERLRRSRTAPVGEVQRAEMLWRYHRGETIAEIVRALKMTRKCRSASLGGRSAETCGRWLTVNAARPLSVEPSRDKHSCLS